MKDTLTFHDLSFEKQAELIINLKRLLKERYEQEAKEKKKSLKELLWEDYLLDYKFEDEEKEEMFDRSFDFFLEEEAEKILKEKLMLPVFINI